MIDEMIEKHGRHILFTVISSIPMIIFVAYVAATYDLPILFSGILGGICGLAGNGIAWMLD